MRRIPKSEMAGNRQTTKHQATRELRHTERGEVLEGVNEHLQEKARMTFDWIASMAGNLSRYRLPIIVRRLP